MIFDKIKQLEQEIESKSFYKSNKQKYVLWKYSTYFTQVINIVLCFFGLYLFLNKTIESFYGKEIILGSITTIILVLWELLKRIQIRDISLLYFKNNNSFNKNNIVQLLITFILIVTSSLIAINGGNELSNKEQNVINNSSKSIDKFSDSLNKTYTVEINKLQSRIDYMYRNNIDKNGITRNLTKTQQEYISDIDNKIINLKNEKYNLISEYKSNINNTKTTNLSKNEQIVYIFIGLSLFFEIIILISIIYCSYFDYNSFYEIKSSEQYKKNELYLKYVDVIYNKGEYKIGDKLESEAQIKEFIKTKYDSVEFIKDFFVTLYSLKIIETRSDKRRYFLKNIEQAKKLINKEFEL
jgi:hypothetical protein